MDAQPTRYRSPLATIITLLGLLAAPAGLRAELLVNAPPGEAPSSGVRPWSPTPAAGRARREEADEEEGTPAASAARPLLALVLALAIPPTMAASEVVSAADTSEKVSKVTTIDTNSGGTTTGGGPPGGPPGGGSPGPQTAPEPASLVSGLVGLGLAGAAALARRRRAARLALAA